MINQISYMRFCESPEQNSCVCQIYIFLDCIQDLKFLHLSYSEYKLFTDQAAEKLTNIKNKSTSALKRTLMSDTSGKKKDVGVRFIALINAH